MYMALQAHEQGYVGIGQTTVKSDLAASAAFLAQRPQLWEPACLYQSTKGYL